MHQLHCARWWILRFCEFLLFCLFAASIDTSKPRINSHRRRTDRCDREVTTPIGDHGARFLSAPPPGDVLLISDYGKGVCARSLLRILGTRARGANAPILVGPARSRSWSDYGGVTLNKANWAEAMEAVGSHDFRPLSLARRLADEHPCHVDVTLGSPPPKNIRPR
ncbi:MAG: hypothetical protein O3C40_02470 [Planctomycetota bacterium]|nr:hypothetical protein [Planctomycetota bacterium]